MPPAINLKQINRHLRPYMAMNGLAYYLSVGENFISVYLDRVNSLYTQINEDLSLKDDDKIIDVTAGQYDAFDYSPPYINGKKTAWYTFKKTPKTQTLNLIQKVLPLSIRYITQSPHDNYQTLDAFM